MDIGYVDKPDAFGKPDRFFDIKNTSLQDIYDMVGTPKELQNKLMELTKGHPGLKNALFSMPVHEQGRNFIAKNILGGMMNDAIAGNNGKNSVKQKVNGFFTELYDMYKPGSSIPISQKSLHNFADRIYSESFQGKAEYATGQQRYEYYQQYGIPKSNATTSSENVRDILGSGTNINETNPATGNRVPIWQNDKFSREEQIAAYVSKPNYFAEDFGITNKSFNETFSSMDEKNRKSFIENIYSDIADDKTGEDVVDKINNRKKWSKTQIKKLGYEYQAQGQDAAGGNGKKEIPKDDGVAEKVEKEKVMANDQQREHLKNKFGIDSDNIKLGEVIPENYELDNAVELKAKYREPLRSSNQGQGAAGGNGKKEIPKDAEYYVLHPNENPYAPAYNPEALSPEQRGYLEDYIKRIENDLGGKQEIPKSDGTVETATKGENVMTNEQRAHLKDKFGIDPDNIKLGGVIPKDYKLDNAVELEAKYRKPLKSSNYGKAALGVGVAVTAGALVLGLSNSRGQQSNAQLYGQQPLSY